MAEFVYGTSDNDVLTGTVADEVFVGGAGADVMTGNGGNDTFNESYDSVRGDRITDLSVGDTINVTDILLADFTYTRIGGTLQYNYQSYGNSTILLGAAKSSNIRFVLTADGTGTDLVVANHWGGISDFNGDGHSDILFQDTSGAVRTWTVAGNVHGDQVNPDAFDANVDPNWRAVETFDMNGDGRSDILFRNANGAVAAWLSKGSDFNQSAYYHVPFGIDWRIAGTGDFNNDGKDDIVWQNVSGAISIWSSIGNGFTENTYYSGSPGAGWLVEAVGDFNGDGRADLLWRNTNGAVAMWTKSPPGFGFNVTAFYQPGIAKDWHIDGVGDFNGDGKEDLLWRNDDGSVSLWRANGHGFDQGAYANSAPLDWHIAQVADVNDDGRADIVWRNDNGAVSTWESTGADFNIAVFNSAAPASMQIAAHNYIL